MQIPGYENPGCREAKMFAKINYFDHRERPAKEELPWEIHPLYREHASRLLYARSS
jgi:hypothetical protein